MNPWLLVALHLNTAQVMDLYYDGKVLWAATSGGLEAYSADGTRLQHVAAELPQARLRSVGTFGGHLAVGTDGQGLAVLEEDGGWRHTATGDGPPRGRVIGILPHQVVTADGRILPGTDRFPSLVQDAVWWDGAIVAGSLAGDLWVWRAGALETFNLGSPVMDLEVAGEEVHIATAVGAAIFDGVLHRLDVPATAAGPIWGTGRGELMDDAGVFARVPYAVTAVQALPDGAYAVGTENGLYLLNDDGLVRLTPAGQICGDFLTGATLWRGHPVVSTFDQGACLLEDDGRWVPIPGMPSTMVNDVLADGDDLWLATSAGLVRWDGQQTELFGVADWGAPRYSPGTQHTAINALARGSRLWVADVLGPVSIDSQDRWRRHHLAVWGTSYQDVTACGNEAWISSEDAGVSHYDGRGWTHHDAETGLPDDWVLAVACDGHGNAWAGTYRDGVWQWDGQAWSELEGLPDRWILSLDWDGSGLWAGTMGGLYRLQQGAWTPITTLPDPAVHDVWVGEEQVLVATEGGLAVLRRGL